MRLCSESVLLIRREDVLKRITPDSPLPLISDHQNDPRWKSLDVEGTIRTVLLGLLGLLATLIEMSRNNGNSMYTTVHSLIRVFPPKQKIPNYLQ